MSMLRPLLAALVLLVAWPATPAQARDKRAAAGHFQRGRALFEAGSFATALDEFNAGYEAYPLPGFLVNIGQCQRKLDHLDDAASAFAKFLESNTGDAPLRAEVREALDEISTERQRRQLAANAEAEARRQRDEAERRHPPEDPAPARVDLQPHAAPAAALAATTPMTTPSVSAEPTKKKSRKWVWAVVGVLAAGAAGAAVGVALLETQPQNPHATLGVLDGRR